ncbi:hypothetical protein Pelo_2782 [Pelomyxa schiedti]|nr:hypothetical protein Pelo_2782 [Pelomyxa schiedti]
MVIDVVATTVVTIATRVTTTTMVIAIIAVAVTVRVRVRGLVTAALAAPDIAPAPVGVRFRVVVLELEKGQCKRAADPSSNEMHMCGGDGSMNNKRRRAGEMSGSEHTTGVLHPSSARLRVDVVAADEDPADAEMINKEIRHLEQRIKEEEAEIASRAKQKKLEVAEQEAKIRLQDLEAKVQELESKITKLVTESKEKETRARQNSDENENTAVRIQLEHTNQDPQRQSLVDSLAWTKKQWVFWAGQLANYTNQLATCGSNITATEGELRASIELLQSQKGQLASRLKAMQAARQAGINHEVQCSQEPEENLKAVEQYRKIGQQLKGNDPSLKALKEAFQQCRDCATKTQHRPFVLVCGSSGVGKTQLAFGLPRKTIYIPLVFEDKVDKAESQFIFYPFLSFTQSLFKCVKKDMEEIEQLSICSGSKLGISTASLSKSLWTHAWVKWVLSHRDMDWPWCAFQEPFSVTLSNKCLADDVRKIALNLSKVECPYFFLDEANLKDKEHLFIRNALRVCGVCPILCGTDVNIANFAGSLEISGSSCSMKPQRWCILVHKKSPSICPMVVSDVTPVLDHISSSDKAVSAFLECLIHTARPRFALAISRCILKMDREIALLKGSSYKSGCDPNSLSSISVDASRGSSTGSIATSTTSSSVSRQNSNILRNLVDNVPELLNILSNNLFKWALNSKPSIRGTSPGKAGQVCLFCADCYFLPESPENCPHAPLSSEHDDRNKTGRRQNSEEKKKPTAVSQKRNETTSAKQQFVAMHFAHLDLEEGVHTLKLSTFRELLWKLRIFNPSSYFPNPNEELWLHLSLLGTQKFAPFFNKFGNATTARVAFYDATHPTCGCTAISNASAPASSANYLEQLAGVAACAASRSIGFSKQGLNSTEFLGFFLRHLLREPKTKDGTWNPTQPPAKIEVHPLLHQFCQLLTPPPSPSTPTKTGSDHSGVGASAGGDYASAAAVNFFFPGVGFMPPPNCEWPTALCALAGLKLSTLKRVPNAEHTDIKIDGGIITIECKNKKVETRDIRDMLKRIDKHTRLTLAVCKHLQDRFFSWTKKKPAAAPPPTTTLRTRNTSKSRNSSQNRHSHSSPHSIHHPSRRSRSCSRSRSSSRYGSHSSRPRSNSSRSRSLSPQCAISPRHGTPPAPPATETGNTAIVRVFIDDATGTALLRPIPNFPNPEISSTEHLLVLIETGDVETDPYSETHNPSQPTTKSKTTARGTKH